MMKLYAGSHDLDDPLLTPLYASLHGLPPILIQVGEDELLLDDAVRFSDYAKKEGVDITLEIWPHMWHGWQTCIPDLPEANQAIEQIARYLHFFKGDPSHTHEQVV
jgi:monoterpene epsilon-lactone hydrolase